MIHNLINRNYASSPIFFNWKDGRLVLRQAPHKCRVTEAV
jgi:hypothetical protein